jgi:hypothetical protein
MPAFSTEIERNVNLQLGSKTFGPVVIDDDVVNLAITVDRANFTNPAARFDAFFDLAIDGGEMREIGGLSGVGGPAFVDRPNVLATSITLRPGVNRTARVRYTLTGARFRTTVTVSGRADGI